MIARLVCVLLGHRWAPVTPAGDSFTSTPCTRCHGVQQSRRWP